MILGTPAKDEKVVLTKYKNKRIHVQNDIREMFNDTNTVTSTCHITFSTRKLFLQMHLTNLNTALQRLILEHLFSFSDKMPVFFQNYYILCLDFEIRY